MNVVAEDAQRGATYTCVAQNSVMRGIQQGEFNTITPYGGNVTSSLAVTALLLRAHCRMAGAGIMAGQIPHSVELICSNNNNKYVPQLNMCLR